MLDAPLVYRDGEAASSFEDNLKRHLHDLSIFFGIVIFTSYRDWVKTGSRLSCTQGFKEAVVGNSCPVSRFGLAVRR